MTALALQRALTLVGHAHGLSLLQEAPHEPQQLADDQGLRQEPLGPVAEACLLERLTLMGREHEKGNPLGPQVFAGPPDAGIKAGDVDQRQPHRLGMGEGALEGRQADRGEQLVTRRA
jgi:hypothetical protein